MPNAPGPWSMSAASSGAPDLRVPPRVARAVQVRERARVQRLEDREEIHRLTREYMQAMHDAHATELAKLQAQMGDLMEMVGKLAPQ